MKSEQIRIQRTKVNPIVKDAYSDDKAFFLSYLDAVIVAAICTFFDMEDTMSFLEIWPVQMILMNVGYGLRGCLVN
jgi:hypothetical protein